MLLKFAEVGVHALAQLVDVFGRRRVCFHIAQGKLLREDLKNIVSS